MPSYEQQIMNDLRRLNEPVTCGSCCGHGEGPGSIALVDGRELVVEPKDERGT